MRNDFADHFTNQQIGKKAPLSTSANDNHAALLAFGLLQYFLVRLFAAPYAHIQGEACRPCLPLQFLNFACRSLLCFGRNLGHQGLVLGVADQR